jgi:phosphate transport system substrate-binding protein
MPQIPQLEINLEALMRYILALALLFFSGASFGATEVTGAGSTFVFPILSQWADAYKKQTGISVNYQSIGSGGGIKMIEGNTVNFGASDKPLTSEELSEKKLVQFPIINGAVVPVIHLKDFKAGQLKLSGPLLADIFLGKITKWNDKAIVDLNKGLTLPDKMISVIRRSDGSGTTFIFTNYLSKVSPTWKEKVGESTAVEWPVGVGAKGNEGVASNVKQIEGAIGYVEYAYALQNKMAYTQLENSAKKFVSPDEKSFKAAATGAEWAKAKDYYLILTNAPGKDSWPIAGSTFILMQKVQGTDKAEQAKEALKFFQWSFENGEAKAREMHYVPIPKTVAKLIQRTWKENIKTTDGAPVATGL